MGTVAIFDPIRTWFIKVHITRQFHFTDNKVYRWFKAQASDLFRHKSKDEAGMDIIWNDRASNISQIQGWLLEGTDTFNIVQGPRGSGKKELVDEALKHRKFTLTIDCKPIQEARGDSATISAVATEQAELVSIVVSTNGRPQKLKPGKPVFLAAFKRLTEDIVLKSRLDLAILGELIKAENASIDKHENELKMLGELPRQPAELMPRITWLLSKIASSQENVEKYEAQGGLLKKTLKEEY